MPSCRAYLKHLYGAFFVKRGPSGATGATGLGWLRWRAGALFGACGHGFGRALLSLSAMAALWRRAQKRPRAAPVEASLSPLQGIARTLEAAR
jgi:hypothetical protein